MTPYAVCHYSARGGEHDTQDGDNDWQRQNPGKDGDGSGIAKVECPADAVTPLHEKRRITGIDIERAVFPVAVVHAVGRRCRCRVESRATLAGAQGYRKDG